MKYEVSFTIEAGGIFYIDAQDENEAHVIVEGMMNCEFKEHLSDDIYVTNWDIVEG